MRAGARYVHHQPFGDDTDTSYRIIPGDANPSNLRFKHGHFDEVMTEQAAIRDDWR